MERIGIDTSEYSSRSLLRHCNSIKIDEQNGLRFLDEFFTSLFVRLGVDFKQYQELAEHHQAFFESSEARIRRITKEGGEFMISVDGFRRVFQPRSGITVSTIHSVKGAEFDTVIAYALLEGRVPHFNDKEEGYEKAMKLLYVIGSRARKNLHLVSETGRGRAGYPDPLPTDCLARCNFSFDSV